MDSEFLEEMMDLNEKVNRCTEAELDLLKTEVQAKSAKVTDQIAEAFVKDKLQLAKSLLNRLRFYVTILRRISDL